MNNSRLFLESPGQFETLGFRPALRQPPSKGEVEVEVIAAGMNFKDVLIALGVMGSEAAAKPLGSEFAGRVSAVGEGVDGFKAGDDVMGVAAGSFSLYITVAATNAVRIPAGITFADAAGLPAAYLTAHFVIE